MGALDDWLAPVSRRDNPLTSYKAEASINEDGSRRTQCRYILDAVRATEGRVAGEIAEVTGYGMHITSRRLSDLKNIGLIRQGLPRIWEISGRHQVTWWPVGDPVQGELL